jgi:hypothetical protein
MDWLCGACLILDGDLRSVLEPLLREYPGRILIFYEDWPWDSACNSNLADGGSLHAGACELAVAVRYARTRGRDAALLEWIKNHPTDWQRLGLPHEFRLIPAPARARIEAALRDSIATGKALKVTMTPTVFINGVRVSQLHPKYIDLAIRTELERARHRR